MAPEPPSMKSKWTGLRAPSGRWVDRLGQAPVGAVLVACEVARGVGQLLDGARRPSPATQIYIEGRRSGLTKHLDVKMCLKQCLCDCKSPLHRSCTLSGLRVGCGSWDDDGGTSPHPPLPIPHWSTMAMHSLSPRTRANTFVAKEPPMFGVRHVGLSLPL